MAKRFTDTGKWDKAWYRKLSPRLKCAWEFLLSKCDHAGFWELDMESLSYFVGEAVGVEEIMHFFDIERVGEDKVYIPGFIEFQYGCSAEELNPANKAHRSVILLLKKRAPSKPLNSPFQGVKDKEKDKDSSLLKSDATQCIQAWGETLQAFGIDKNPALDEQAIARLIQAKGAEQTEQALIGARFEAKSESFNPADHLSVARVAKHFDKFVNQAIRRKPKGRETVEVKIPC